MNPWGAPVVLRGHPADEIPHFARHRGSAAALPAAGESPPVEPVTGPVPPHDGLGFHDDEYFSPARPDAPKSHPEDTIGYPDAGARLLGHRGELLPKGEVLQQELPPRTNERTKRPNDHRCKANHGRGEAAGLDQNRQRFQRERHFGDRQERIAKDLADAPDAIYRQNTRQYLERLEANRPRIDYLVKNFPKSAFARAMKEDFDKAIDIVRGRKYDLTADDLSYRKLSAHRVEKAVELALRSRDELVAKLGAVPIESLPEVDPIRGNRASIAGRVVTLPRLEDEISEAGHGWYVAKGAGTCIFLVDTATPAFIAIFRAMERFKRVIAPDINDVFELIGKVTGRPTMVATGREIYTGIIVQPLAALADGKMFVDVSGGGTDAPFAGEANVVKPPRVESRSDMTPTETFRSFINALKLGDQDLWQSFFALWSCELTGIGDQYVYDPEGGPTPNAHNLYYVIARRVIMADVYDVRVVTVGKPKTVYEKDGTRVEMVVLDVDPIGLFDGEYRSFRSVDVHRIWHLQRVNGGPWKIVSEQGL